MGRPGGQQPGAAGISDVVTPRGGGHHRSDRHAVEKEREGGRVHLQHAILDRCGEEDLGRGPRPRGGGGDHRDGRGWHDRDLREEEIVECDAVPTSIAARANQPQHHRLPQGPGEPHVHRRLRPVTHRSEAAPGQRVSIQVENAPVVVVGGPARVVRMEVERLDHHPGAGDGGEGDVKRLADRRSVHLGGAPDGIDVVLPFPGGRPAPGQVDARGPGPCHHHPLAADRRLVAKALDHGRVLPLSRRERGKIEQCVSTGRGGGGGGGSQGPKGEGGRSGGGKPKERFHRSNENGTGPLRVASNLGRT